MRSISSGGQPWKVERVSVSEMRVVKGRSRRCAQRGGICGAEPLDQRAARP